MQISENEITIVYNSVEDNSLPNTKIFNLVNVIVTDKNYKLRELSVILSNDELLHKLNHKWLNVDATTDVLSFDLCDDWDKRQIRVSSNDLKIIEGEIYISLDRVQAQARENGIEPETELLKLIAHGILHLCGMDHDDNVSLREMIDRGENYVQRVL